MEMTLGEEKQNLTFKMWLLQAVTFDLTFHCANNPMMLLSESAVRFHTASSFYISDVTAMGAVTADGAELGVAVTAGLYMYL